MVDPSGYWCLVLPVDADREPSGLAETKSAAAP